MITRQRIYALYCKSKWVYAELAKIGHRPWEKLIIFDVGSNAGTSFGYVARWCFRSQFYAFEPTPYLVAEQKKFTSKFKNYHLIPKAVAEKPGHAMFNVAGQSDWGCSSLLEFSPGLDKTWPGRTDFVLTDKIEVEVIRLDDFVRENKIPRIDFMHVDTQGSDLSVLRSLGEEIHRLQAGEIEVPVSKEVMLYQNQHTKEEAYEFLDKHGFEVWKVEPSSDNEHNVFFRRKLE